MPRDLAFHGLWDLPLFIILALACAALGWLYVRVFYGLRDWFFKPMPIPGTSSRRWAACCWDSWP